MSYKRTLSKTVKKKKARPHRNPRPRQDPTISRIGPASNYVLSWNESETDPACRNFTNEQDKRTGGDRRQYKNVVDFF